MQDNHVNDEFIIRSINFTVNEKIKKSGLTWPKREHPPGHEEQDCRLILSLPFRLSSLVIPYTNKRMLYSLLVLENLGKNNKQIKHLMQQHETFINMYPAVAKVYDFLPHPEIVSDRLAVWLHLWK